MAYARTGLREQVYEKLKGEIATLQLAPGVMVSENDLAGRFGVSRMPVHDALMTLSKNHLVDIYPQRGSQVSLIDLKLVDEARFIRQTLETVVTISLFDTITPQQMQQLEQSVQRQRLYLQNQQLEDFSREDNLFHRLIYMFAEREETLRIVSDIMTHFDRMRVMTLRVNFGRNLVEEHDGLVRAIREKDAEAVKVLVARHLTDYRENLEEIRGSYSSYFK